MRLARKSGAKVACESPAAAAIGSRISVSTQVGPRRANVRARGSDSYHCRRARGRYISARHLPRQTVSAAALQPKEHSMSVSPILDRHLVAVEPSEVVTVKPIVAPQFPMPDGPLFTVDPAVAPTALELDMAPTARELDALVDAGRLLVTVDPAWSLWALECAVDAEYLQDLDDDKTLKTAMSLLAAGVDELYRAERSVGPTDYDHAEPRIDRERLNVAMDAVGHLGKPAFRARIADAYDAVGRPPTATQVQVARSQARARTKKRRDRRARIADAFDVAAVVA
jgi:hypothetical protein